MSQVRELPVLDQTIPVCRHLRSKGMFVYGDDEDDPNGHPATSIYWCLMSMTSFGPDDLHVDAHSCRDGGRSCFKPY